MSDARVREGIFSIANRKAELDLSASASATTQPSVPKRSAPTVPKRSARVIKIKPIAAASELPQENTVVIGKGTCFDGPILECDILDVHGVVDADVIAAKLIVREGGQLRGTVHTSDAVISGTCDGVVAVNGHLDVRSTGRVQGDVSYHSLALATGAAVTGKFRHHDDGAEPSANSESGNLFAS